MKESQCQICGKQRDIHHASTWGVAGALLGCNTYYLCSACAAGANNWGDRSTLSPCNIKHVRVK